MGERTITVICRDCDTTFEHTTRSNKPKLLCDPCLKESQRKATREYQRKKRAGTKKVPQHVGCRDCGKLWDKPHHRPSSCAACRRKANVEYQRQLRAANPTPPRVFTCKACGAEIVRVWKSGTATYCDGCKPAVRSRHQRVGDAKRREERGTTLATHCHYCGAEFDQPKKRSRHPASCFACQRQRHYAYMKARVTERIAEARCVDCGEPVNSKRKGPRLRCEGCRKLRQLERWREYAGRFNHIRRARMRGVGSENFTRREIFDRDGWRCGICGRKIRKAIKYPHPMSAALDHKIPLGANAGATHSRLNAQPAHKVCNERKNKRVVPVQLLLFA